MYFLTGNTSWAIITSRGSADVLKNRVTMGRMSDVLFGHCLKNLFTLVMALCLGLTRHVEVQEFLLRVV